MTQVSVTLTFGQGHRSRSNVQKMAKIYTIGHISNAILLGTEVQLKSIITAFVTHLGVALLYVE